MTSAVGSSFLLSLIYISFISLGLPDSLLGSSWPVMHIEIGADISLLGSLALSTCIGTIISTIIYSKFCRYLKPGPLSSGCAFLTGAAMLLMSFTDSLLLMYVFTFMMGLGAGAVDASLNTYVVLNYKAKHLNFLSAFWSIGTIFGPSILSLLFSSGRSWRDAYRYLSYVQMTIGLILVLNLGKWKTSDDGNVAARKEPRALGRLLGRKSVRLSMLSVLAYCSMESLIFCWTASYCTTYMGITESDAAFAVSLIYWGFMLGNILIGLLDGRIGDDRLILMGLCTILLAGILFLDADDYHMLLASTFLAGVGCGPIITAIYHQAPLHFGKKDADSVEGLISASSYVGSGITPVLFGLCLEGIGEKSLPVLIILASLLQILILKAKKDSYRNDNAIASD